jgi:hypothetical protein
VKVYVFRSGQQFGPYSEEHLKTYLQQGSIAESDTARMDGSATWTTVGALLAPSKGSPPPPPFAGPPAGPPFAGPPAFRAPLPPRAPQPKSYWKIVLIVAACVIVVGIGAAIVGAAMLRTARLRTRDQEIAAAESKRTEVLAAIGQVNAKIRARVTESPNAFLALVATGNALAKTIKESDSSLSGAETVASFLGVGYCLFNSEECTSLVKDLGALSDSKTALEQQRDTLTQEAGYRIKLTNSCSEPVKVSVSEDDLMYGDAHTWQYDFKTGDTLYPQQDGYYLRSKARSFLYYAKGTSVEWAGDNSVTVLGKSLPMRRVQIDPDSAWELSLTLTCKAQ